MCTAEGKKMGMIMGEAKAAEPAEEKISAAEASENASEAGEKDIASQIEQKIAEDEEATVELPKTMTAGISIALLIRRRLEDDEIDSE